MPQYPQVQICPRRQKCPNIPILYTTLVKSAQLKTDLVVHGGGQNIVEKMIDWELHVEL